jgi:hypothetical protein
MRETKICREPEPTDGAADNSDASAAGDFEARSSDAHALPQSGVEVSDASSSAVIPTFDTHARHTRIRVFLHSFKGAVLYMRFAARIFHRLTIRPGTTDSTKHSVFRRQPRRKRMVTSRTEECSPCAQPANIV